MLNWKCTCKVSATTMKHFKNNIKCKRGMDTWEKLFLHACFDCVGFAHWIEITSSNAIWIALWERFLSTFNYLFDTTLDLNPFAHLEFFLLSFKCICFFYIIIIFSMDTSYFCCTHIFMGNIWMSVLERSPIDPLNSLMISIFVYRITHILFEIMS